MAIVWKIKRTASDGKVATLKLDKAQLVFDTQEAAARVSTALTNESVTGARYEAAPLNDTREKGD